MGSTESNERQLFIGVILQLLRKEESKLKNLPFNHFFHLYKSTALGFYNRALLTWGKVGKQLKAYCVHHGLEKIPTYTFPLWNMTRGALDPAHEFEKVPVKEESKVGKYLLNKKANLKRYLL